MNHAPKLHFLLGSVVLSLSACSASPPAPDGDDVGSSAQEVIGGAPTNDFPSVGLLMLQGGATCTGTAISPNWLLTAGHCVGPISFQTVDGVVHRVTRRWVHPDHRLAEEAGVDEFEHDIAVLEVENGFSIWSSIDPEAARPGEWFAVVGYGRNSADAPGAVRSWGGTQVSSVGQNSFVMAGHRTSMGATTSAGTCFGDSGGPVFRERNGLWWLLGVTSAVTAECATNLAQGHYIRVDYQHPHYGWIWN
jgi:S1-C subfamily serine protease